jgi:hypothetical protein
MAWLRFFFKRKNAIRWLNISAVTDIYFDTNDDNCRVTFYAGSDVMLSLVIDNDDVEVYCYDDYDATVVIKWDIEEMFNGEKRAKEVTMRRLANNVQEVRDG